MYSFFFAQRYKAAKASSHVHAHVHKYENLTLGYKPCPRLYFLTGAKIARVGQLMLIQMSQAAGSLGSNKETQPRYMMIRDTHSTH